MSDTIVSLTEAFSEGRLSSVPFESVTVVLKHLDSATTTTQVQLFADAIFSAACWRVAAETLRVDLHVDPSTTALACAFLQRLQEALTRSPQQFLQLKALRLYVTPRFGLRVQYHSNEDDFDRLSTNTEAVIQSAASRPGLTELDLTGVLFCSFQDLPIV